MTLKESVVRLLKEFVILEKIKDEFFITPITKDEAEPFVMKHYLKAFPADSKRIYGIYRKSTEGNSKVGIIIYGLPYFTAAKFLEPEVSLRETMELKRLFIDDLGIKNLESYAIGQSLKLLKRDEPNVKVVITFADDSQGHKGTIYQATNGIYLGKIGDKHKYIYIIGGDEKLIRNKIQNKIKPYPKKEINEGEDDYFMAYSDIGHENKKGNKLWYWYDDDGTFEVKDATKVRFHDKDSDYQGRYDAKTNTVSIVNMKSYESGASATRLDKVPKDLIQRLQFEFGDDIKMRTFFEENIKESKKDTNNNNSNNNGELYYLNIGHNYDEHKNPTKIWWCERDLSNFKIKSGFGCHPLQVSGSYGYYWGRFDPKRNMVSVASDNGDKDIPINLKRRLQFEFGDDVIFKTFFDENIITR